MKFDIRWLVQDTQQRDVNDDLLAAVNALGQWEFVGSGTPNGAVTASPGATYRNRSGGAGTSFYVKESGVNTNTGWVGK